MTAPRTTSEAEPRGRRLLVDGPLGALVREGRWDEALARLSQARDAAPRDPDIAEAIRTVRERALASGLERLGSIEAVPVRTGASPALGADERYLLGLVTDRAAIDELLDTSTLGRHRTVRALCGLLDLGVIQTAPVNSSRSVPDASAALKHVVVADGHPSSAALTRTMLRLALGGGTQLETVGSAAELMACGAKQRPDLLVTELMLVGGDALAAVRALRKALGQVVPALIISSRLELDFAVGRAPERSAVVIRPIEKSALLDALASLGFVRKL